MFSNNLRNARREKGMTQAELAEIIGVNKSVIGQYETERAEPKISTLKKICKALECSADKLIFGLLLIINELLTRKTKQSYHY